MRPPQVRAATPRPKQWRPGVLSGIIVTSRINGTVPIMVDWQLNPTNNGYKVTNLFVGGINMASMQHSEVVSVIQRNSGQMQALLVALRVKNASNGLLRY